MGALRLGRLGDSVNSLGRASGSLPVAAPPEPMRKQRHRNRDAPVPPPAAVPRAGKARKGWERADELAARMLSAVPCWGVEFVPYWNTSYF